MHITDIMDVEGWRRLEAELFEQFGCNPGVTDDNGVMFCKSPRFGNELCPRVKGDPKGLAAICAVAGQNFLREVKEKMATCVSECDAGICKYCVPVVVDGEFLGAVGCCGYLEPDGEVETFMVTKSMDMDEAEAERLAATVPHMRREEIDDMIAATERRVAELVDAYKARA